MKGWKHWQPGAAARFDKPRRLRKKRKSSPVLVLYGRPTEEFLARARALRMRIILRPVEDLPEPRN